MKTKLGTVSVAVGFLMATGSLWAHHSDAVYDMTRLKIIKATVTQHMMVNPHQIIKAKVRDADGRVTPWIIIGAAVKAHMETGWTQDTLKSGDAITIAGFAYRDGRPNMTWMRILTDSGKMLPITGAKNSKLARYLGKYGKDQLSAEDYAVYKKSLNYTATDFGNP